MVVFDQLSDPMCLMGPNSSLGSFDDEGVMPASILKANEKSMCFIVVGTLAIQSPITMLQA